MKKYWTFLGLFLTIFLIWYAGPIIGIEEESTRIYIIVGLVLIVILSIFWKRMMASKMALLIESYLKKQADKESLNTTSLDEKDAIENVKSQMVDAINTLKKSEIGGGNRGNSALYELPWYIIIGPPDAGKSTLIHNSGLDFPLPGKSKTIQEIKGMGGTRNCDWWFTNDAIIIDTAGRYTTGESDNVEWLGFLKLLKKSRKNRPINGVIIAVNVESLMRNSEKEIREDAEKIRSRSWELLEELEVRFPVYLFFTKCDMISGFVDFFGHLTKDEREQVWGCTFTEQQGKTGNIANIFQVEMDRLEKSLCDLRLETINRERNLEKKEKIFQFPLQFSAVKGKIAHFVSCLLQDNVFRKGPVLRGFYFTCGTQEGVPIDMWIEALEERYKNSKIEE